MVCAVAFTPSPSPREVAAPQDELRLLLLDLLAEALQHREGRVRAVLPSTVVVVVVVVVVLVDESLAPPPSIAHEYCTCPHGRDGPPPVLFQCSRISSAVSHPQSLAGAALEYSFGLRLIFIAGTM